MVRKLVEASQTKKSAAERGYWFLNKLVCNTNSTKNTLKTDSPSLLLLLTHNGSSRSTVVQKVYLQTIFSCFIETLADLLNKVLILTFALVNP